MEHYSRGGSWTTNRDDVGGDRENCENEKHEFAFIECYSLLEPDALLRRKPKSATVLDDLQTGFIKCHSKGSARATDTASGGSCKGHGSIKIHRRF